jgi:hypothetical protein
MAHHQLVISDRGTSADRMQRTVTRPKAWFRVVRPMFKRGRAWQPGERIQLDPDTGERAADRGDVTPDG